MSYSHRYYEILPGDWYVCFCFLKGAIWDDSKWLSHCCVRDDEVLHSVFHPLQLMAIVKDPKPFSVGNIFQANITRRYPTYGLTKKSLRKLDESNDMENQQNSKKWDELGVFFLELGSVSCSKHYLQGEIKVSHQKNLVVYGIGDYTTQLNGDYNKPL